MTWSILPVDDDILLASGSWLLQNLFQKQLSIRQGKYCCYSKTQCLVCCQCWQSLEGIGSSHLSVKRQLRQLRKYGNEEDIRKLAHEFHTLVKRLSKVSKEGRKLERNKRQLQQRKACLSLFQNGSHVSQTIFSIKNVPN